MVATLVKLDSGNSKTGRMAVTYRTQDTCPTSCPLMAAGCYARGRIFGIPARLGKVDEDGSTPPSATWRCTCPPGGAFRANVSGDILGDDGQGRSGLRRRVVGSRDRPAGRRGVHLHPCMARATPDVAPGMTVNASCESAEDIAEAAAAGWATVVVDPGPDDPETLIGRPWQAAASSSAPPRPTARPVKSAACAPVPSASPRWRSPSTARAGSSQPASVKEARA